MYTSLIYNVNVATSVTGQGRASTAAMTMLFESFLANSVQFGSIDEVLVFIRNIRGERKKRKYNDLLILDKPITASDCFAKLVLSCGYRWVPEEDELEIIWKAVRNLGQEDLNRIYYKNNLYEFLNNSTIKEAIIKILETLETPYNNPLKCPKEIEPMMVEFTNLLKEYVYYRYQYIDRIERCDHMIKSVIVISDTDSAIISLDAWFRYVNELVKFADLKIKKYPPIPAFEWLEKDEFGDFTNRQQLSPFDWLDPEYDYDFENDKLIELKHTIEPFTIFPEDNLRWSIINMMSYVLDNIVNDYMEQYVESNHAINPNAKCKMIAKNEFLFRRVLMTEAKKSYAAIQELQEGHTIPKDEQLDIKGIASMAKSSMADSTRNALKKILLEDIMNADPIDQFKIVKHLGILEKRIIDSVQSGSREFYKPVTIKSIYTYENPMRIQGIKAAYTFNKLKPSSDNIPDINLEERNAIDIAKIVIDEDTIEKIKDKYPEVYDNAKQLLEEKDFKHRITSIALPLDIKVPDWVLEFIDYKTIVDDNISGFPLDSVGIQTLGKKNVNYTNIIQL